jgi:hypothetical protein
MVEANAALDDWRKPAKKVVHEAPLSTDLPAALYSQPRPDNADAKWIDLAGDHPLPSWAGIV